MAWSEAETQTQTQSQSQSQSQYASQAEGSRPKGTFDHLMKPTKNIAQSWGVDIAKELSDYASSLGIVLDCDISPLLSEDEGMRVDFAEAALLLQGSTTIYCRKVEHLYNLVLAAVEIMNQVKSRASRASGSRNSDRTDDDESAIWDTENMNFLDLDDEFPSAKSTKILRNIEDHIATKWSTNDPTTLDEIPHLLRMPTSSDAEVSGKGTLRMDYGTMDASGAMFLLGASESKIGDDLAYANEPTFDDDFDDHGDDDHSPEVLRHDSPTPLNMEDSAPNLNFDDISPRGQPEPNGVSQETQLSQPEPRRELDPHDDSGIAEKPCRVVKPKYRAKRQKPEEGTLLHLLGKSKVFSNSIQLLRPKRARGRHVTFPAIREAAQTRRRKITSAKSSLLKTTRNRHGFGVDVRANIPIFDDDDDDMNDDFGLFDSDELASSQDNEPILSLGFDEDNDILDNEPALDWEKTVRRHSLGTESALQDIVDGYQEACLQYVRKTSMLWEKKAANADLAERVEEWSSRIRPILEEEDKRPVYDIQACGSEVLSRVNKFEPETTTKEVSMRTAFQAAEPFEACRFFLATLQLANNYDVEIIANEEMSPELRLLDSERVLEIRREETDSEKDKTALADRTNSTRPSHGTEDLKSKSRKAEEREEKTTRAKKRRRSSSMVRTPGRNRVRAQTYMR